MEREHAVSRVLWDLGFDRAKIGVGHSNFKSKATFSSGIRPREKFKQVIGV